MVFSQPGYLILGQSRAIVQTPLRICDEQSILKDRKKAPEYQGQI